ncbi:MAG: hypothetical protein AAF533_28255 [Acidobacteriota bacterium]
MSEEVRGVVQAAVDAAVGRLKDELSQAISSGLPASGGGGAPAAGGFDGGGIAAFRKHVFDLFSGSGQVELLNRLMAATEPYWDRSILFLIKGADLQPWAARGFAGGIGDDAAKAVSIPANADTLLAASLSGEGGQTQNSLLFDAIGAPQGRSAAVPLGIRGKAAAVLYCDGPRVGGDEPLAAMELLTISCAASVELGMLTKRTGLGVRQESVEADLGGGAAAPAPAAPAAPAAPEAAPAAPAMDFSAMAAPAPEATPAPAAEGPPSGGGLDFAAPAPAEGPASSGGGGLDFAAPAAEPAAPEPAAPAPAPAAPEGPASAVGGGPAVDAAPAADAGAKKFSRWKPVREQLRDGDEEDASLASIPEAERPKHMEAKKIAKLLVSEIKLYNEAKVAVGKKNNDLYERLKEDIERSRQTYLERVDKSIVGSTDYFREELVSGLADGNAAALGMP